MTEKLYYQDSHQKDFIAQVTACEWDEKRACYQIVLDRTCFFPEEGGQYADSGTLEGICVEDVREKGDSILHYCREPLPEGSTVHGCIDFEERFSKMQQHTGEHIVSGLIHQHFGYDNVGFHLGKELVTLDFNGSFTKEQLQQIELEANEAIVKDIPVQTAFPSKEDLSEMDYRSKKELTGQVRIVTVLGYDVCACCAPHVNRTGEIGMIRLIDAARHKGGTRLTMVCGFRALADYQIKEDNVQEISRLLSARPCETADAVKRLQKELSQWKDKLFRIQNRYLEQKLDKQEFLLFEEDLDKNAARRFVDTGMHRCDGICGIFIGNDRQGYQYILGSQQTNLREFLKGFHETFPGKGGGKPEMVQGTVTALCQDLQEYFVAFPCTVNASF